MVLFAIWLRKPAMVLDTAQKHEGSARWWKSLTVGKTSADCGGGWCQYGWYWNYFMGCLWVVMTLVFQGLLLWRWKSFWRAQSCVLQERFSFHNFSMLSLGSATTILSRNKHHYAPCISVLDIVIIARALIRRHLLSYMNSFYLAKWKESIPRTILSRP